MITLSLVICHLFVKQAHLRFLTLFFTNAEHVKETVPRIMEDTHVNARQVIRKIPCYLTLSVIILTLFVYNVKQVHLVIAQV